jgi:hypothetical protein
MPSPCSRRRAGIAGWRARARRGVSNGRAGVGAGNAECAGATMPGCQVRESGGGVFGISGRGQRPTVMFGRGSGNWGVLLRQGQRTQDSREMVWLERVGNEYAFLVGWWSFLQVMIFHAI